MDEHGDVREQCFRWLKFNLRELQVKGIWDRKKTGIAMSKLTKLNHIARGTYDPNITTKKGDDTNYVSR